MISLRRFLVFQAFLLWQGGFLFYAGVVVPIGTQVLGSPLLQGQVTQQVTNWLNLFGAVWAVVFVWDVYAARDPNGRRRQKRLLWWAICVLLLALLAVLHSTLDAVLENYDESAYARFRPWHIIYLWLSTFHWLIGLVLAWQTLSAWRAEDESRRS